MREGLEGGGNADRRQVEHDGSVQLRRFVRWFRDLDSCKEKRLEGLVLGRKEGHEVFRERRCFVLEEECCEVVLGRREEERVQVVREERRREEECLEIGFEVSFEVGLEKLFPHGREVILEGSVEVLVAGRLEVSFEVGIPYHCIEEVVRSRRHEVDGHPVLGEEELRLNEARGSRFEQDFVDEEVECRFEEVRF